MHLFRDRAAPLGAADAATFSGPAHTKLLASSTEGAAVHMYRVEFGDGGRTNWHAHSGPQWLFVIAGRIRAQAWGGEIHDLAAGDAILIPPGEKHWHGAVPGGPGTHLAVNVNVKTEWLEPVTDEHYFGSL
jgi:quercetin dioxygenase-like cupin family protein